MTEWLRDGLEGHSLKAILRLYILGMVVLAPVIALLGLLLGAQTAFQVTPLLVFVLGGIEYGICYLYPLWKHDDRNDADLEIFVREKTEITEKQLARAQKGARLLVDLAQSVKGKWKGDKSAVEEVHHARKKERGY